MLDVYMGYDSREHIAAKVCEYSIVRRASEPVNVLTLNHKELREWWGFNRTWRMDEVGQWWDERDGRPFSTEFSHARFMAPIIHKKRYEHDKNVGKWGLFVDCDFLFLDDVNKLLEYTDDADAIVCVQRNWKGDEGVKMDNVIQAPYPKKLWSSIFLFNVEHPSYNLTVDDVNYKEGSWLHQFKWVDELSIGDMPRDWNYIPGDDTLDDSRIKDVKAIHYSFGGPWMNSYEEVEYAEKWRKEYAHYISSGPRAY